MPKSASRQCVDVTDLHQDQTTSTLSADACRPPVLCHDADDATSGAPFAASTGLNTPFQNKTTNIHDNSVEHNEGLAVIVAATLIRCGQNLYCEPGDAFMIAPHCTTNALQVLFHCNDNQPMEPGGNNQATVVAKEVSEVLH